MESEESMNKQAQAQFIENQYVKVFGIIKSLQGQKNLQAFRIMPIKELNEITHHILDCMSANIYYHSKGGCESMDMAMAGGNSMMNRNSESQNGSGLTGTHQAVIIHYINFFLANIKI
jgi:hypothetical protein